MPKMMPDVFSSSAIHRYNNGVPVLTKNDIPYPAECIYNAGVAKLNGKYVMVFRDDFDKAPWGGCYHIVVGIAFSDDGKHFEVRNKPFITPELLNDPDVKSIYDPRLTVIDGRCYICFAVDTNHGIRGGIAVTDDFEKVEVLSLSVPDDRNMVLFPEKINGRYIRLERPMPMYSRNNKTRFDIWLSESPDLSFWGKSRLVLGVEDVPFANDKIGPGAPPETKWETDEGLRTNVIFPGGMILEDNGEVKIYYGASDTVECLATADVNALLSLVLK